MELELGEGDERSDEWEISQEVLIEAERCSLNVMLEKFDGLRKSPGI